MHDHSLSWLGTHMYDHSLTWFGTWPLTFLAWYMTTHWSGFVHDHSLSWLGTWPLTFLAWYMTTHFPARKVSGHVPRQEGEWPCTKPGK
jgi:hypothetical protein